MLVFLTFPSVCSFCVCFSFSHTGPDGERKRGSGRETELERGRGKAHNAVMPISEISRTLSDLTRWQKPLRDYNENFWQDSGYVCVCLCVVSVSRWMQFLCAPLISCDRKYLIWFMHPHIFPSHIIILWHFSSYIFQKSNALRLILGIYTEILDKINLPIFMFVLFLINVKY